MNPVLIPSNQADRFESSSSLPLNRESDEWATVECLLQLIFRTGNISLRSLWSVSNPAVLTRFERRSRDLTGIVSTVIASEDIGPAVTMAGVCDRGFPTSPAGIQVQVGNLPLPSGYLNAGLDGTRKQGRGRRMFEFLVVKVAVGKSLVMDAGSSDDAKLLSELGQEYDSILVRPTSAETQAMTVTAATPASITKGFLPPHAFCQSYIVRDGSQILPMFVCRFEVDTDKEEPLALQPCQNCEENPATIWCAADSAALCPECDEAHHSANRLTQRHIRVPINEKPRDSGPCAIRADKSAELWSPAMGIAVCAETQKEHFPLSTVFEDIKDAYRSSVRLARREDTDLASVKEKLVARIKAQDEAVESLERMLTEAEGTSYRKIADGLQKALSLTEKRTSVLIEREKELQVKIQFLQWAEAVLHPYAHVLPPTEWLALWLSHYRMVRSYILTAPISGDENVQPTTNAEIKIEGHISVRDALIRN